MLFISHFQACKFPSSLLQLAVKNKTMILYHLIHVLEKKKKEVSMVSTFLTSGLGLHK